MAQEKMTIPPSMPVVTSYEFSAPQKRGHAKVTVQHARLKGNEQLHSVASYVKKYLTKQQRQSGDVRIELTLGTSGDTPAILGLNATTKRILQKTPMPFSRRIQKNDEDTLGQLRKVKSAFKDLLQNYFSLLLFRIMSSL